MRKLVLFTLLVFSGCFYSETSKELKNNEEKRITADISYKGEKVPFILSDIFYLKIKISDSKITMLKVKGNCVLVDNSTISQDDKELNNMTDIKVDGKKEIDVKVYVFSGDANRLPETRLIFELYERGIRTGEESFELNRKLTI